MNQRLPASNDKGRLTERQAYWRMKDRERQHQLDRERIERRQYQAAMNRILNNQEKEGA